MNLLAMIAWRNILRHKGKSFVIGAILFLGALLMTVGNGVISGMDKGLQKNIVNGFTGDIVLISDKQEGDNVFIDFMGKAVEPINNFPEIREVLAQQLNIDKVLPIGKNMAMVLNEEDGPPGTAFLIGVDFNRYRKMFPDNMRAIEGALLEGNERGVLIPSGARKEFYEFTELWFKPAGAPLDTAEMPEEARKNIQSIVVKDNLVLMGFGTGNTSSDIRLNIKGVIKYRALNHIWGHFVLTDIESYRECLGYFSAADKSIELTSQEKVLLESDNIDDLFSDDNSFASSADEPAARETPENVGSAGVETDIDAGTYNLVLVKIVEKEKLDVAVASLNKVLSQKNLGVRAVSWKKAIGTIGSMAVLIKSALFIFVMLLFFVAIIIIVNTLSMAAIERTSEIGMMRAVGARKGFIRMMFLGETAMLSVVFGGAGIIIGFAITEILQMIGFTTTNDMIQLLYGGDTFHPFLSIGDVLLTVFQLVLVTIIAVVYPIKVASSITPLDAISRD